MNKLPWLILIAAIGSIALVSAWLGWPQNLADAGGFASLVGALLTPMSLILLVLTLNAQERARSQATRDHFPGALIEDDCRILDGMAERDVKNATFYTSRSDTGAGSPS